MSDCEACNGTLECECTRESFPPGTRLTGPPGCERCDWTEICQSCRAKRKLLVLDKTEEGWPVVREGDPEGAEYYLCCLDTAKDAEDLRRALRGETRRKIDVGRRLWTRAGWVWPVLREGDSTGSRLAEVVKAQDAEDLRAHLGGPHED